MTGETALPNVGEILAPLLQRAAPHEVPLLIAIAERMAATRYRAWAADPSQSAHRAVLLECAGREEEIARRVESLYPNAGSIQRDLRARIPDIEGINGTIFAGRPLAQQFAIQAQGERLGAATWRSLAAHESDAQRRATLLSCADLEEASAACLESLLVDR